MFVLRSKGLRALLLILITSLATGKALAGQESSLLRYDPKDQSFTRIATTLKLNDGFISATKTKLDPASPAYTALIQKRSFTGKVKLFGQICDANYAPMTDGNGQLTGALFVGTDCHQP
jgi:hypothetical protein